MWDHPRIAWAIYWIIIGSLVQAQGFSTTVVKVGEDAILDCGLQTKVAERYLRWQAITNDNPEELAYDLRDGIPRCDDRIINCTLHTNGSIQLESVSKEDGARHYRCLRGDDNGFNYYSDHRLLVLSKESPSISQSPTPATAFKVSRKGIVHSYGEPACEDDVDGNLLVVCYPPSGIIVDREYETIQCNCTDSDGLMDSVTFPVSRQMSSPPSIETPHRESVSSYNIGKKGVLHGYSAPVCEDDVDGNLPVVCYPPSGIIVDREYETIQCNCTDSDGQVDSVTFPVTSVTHWVHPGWENAFISYLVISILIILVLILIFRYLYMKLKKSKAYHSAADPEEMISIQRSTKDQQISDLEDKIATVEATFSKISTQSESLESLLKHLQELMEMHEMLGTKKINLVEILEKGMNVANEMTVEGWENRDLKKLLEEKQGQKIRDWDQAACEHQCNEQPQGILEFLKDRHKASHMKCV